MITGVQKAETKSGWSLFLQTFEPALVLAVGLVAIWAERLPQEIVLIGLALLLLPLLLRFVVLGQVMTSTLVSVPLLLLLILLVSTRWVTPSWQQTWPQVVRMLWGIAVMLTVIDLMNQASHSQEQADQQRLRLPPHLIAVTIIFLGMGLLLTVIGLAGMEATGKIALLDPSLALLPEMHIYGLGRFNSNNVAGIILLFIPLAFALTLGPLQLRQRSLLLWLTVKTVAALLTLFFSVALILTQTRGAWLAAVCALLLILSLLGRRGKVLMALLVTVIAVGLFAIGPAQLLDQLIVRDASAIDSSAWIQDRNVAARLILWQRAIHGIADAPMTGMGLGAFAVVSQQPYPQVAGFVPDADMSHVHNIVLQMGVDFGVPGVIAWVSLLIMIGWQLTRLVQRSSLPTLLHTWSVGLLGTFAAYLAYNMLNAILLGSRPAFVVWFFFGLCIGTSEWMQRQPNGLEDDNVQQSMALFGPEQEWSEWERQAWAATAGPRER
ncbi:MAG: O-antigen ligase family protein [Caldilineaceae bacterium]|nr:O-antigen ligase family protein [Caldilineaceae bacterium]